jgi:hypothetical protein
MMEINKILAKTHFKCKFLKMMQKKTPTILRKHVTLKLFEVSLSCLHFSLMFSEGEVKCPYFVQMW